MTDDRTETITDPAQIRATDDPDERNTTIVGMVDDLGRPATIYTPPEVLRRDPARWPTPAEFVSEWEQHSPERRLYLAERILSDAQKVERLDEAIDRARWERAQAEDAETEATARAESAEAEVVTLRAKVAAVEAERDAVIGQVQQGCRLLRLSGNNLAASTVEAQVLRWPEFARAALEATGEGQ